MLFIILVLAVMIITIYAIVIPYYLPGFLAGESLDLKSIKAESIATYTLTYRKTYMVSQTPSLLNSVTPPLDSAVLSGGNFGTALEGYPGTYTLRDTKQDSVTCQVKPPTGWKTNTGVIIRAHFVPLDNSAGQLDLRLWYKKAAVSSVYPIEFSNVRINKDIFLNSANDHLTAIFPEIDLTGESEQTMILLTFERQANGGDSTDTYAADIQLLSVEIDFQINKPGKQS